MLACRLMDSHVWGVLARRMGNEAFLRHAFPLLLVWLERGVEEADADDVHLHPGNGHTSTTRRQAGKGASGATSHDTQKARGDDETRPATSVSVSASVSVSSRRSGTPGGAVAPTTSGRVGGADRAPSPGKGGAFRGPGGGDGGGAGMTRTGGADSAAASRVQTAAAAAISLEVFECLGERESNKSLRRRTSDLSLYPKYCFCYEVRSIIF